MNVKPKAYIPGLFVYEPGRPLEEVAREHGLQPDSLVKLASNENALGPSPKAIEAMQAAIQNMHLYPDGGVFYLRNALAQQLGVEPDQLIFGAGSNEIIELLGHVFLSPGTNIVMSERAFIIYKLMASTFEAATKMVPMQGFAHDLPRMLTVIDAKTRIVFIANPNNPTGTVVTHTAIRSFMEKVPDHVLVAFDEAYIELMDPLDVPPTLDMLKRRSNVIVLRTFSKAYGLAGLRIGYGIAAPELIQLLEKFRQPFNVNAMAQAAALAALADKDHLERTRDLVEEGLAFFEAHFSEMGLETVPSVANFLLVETGEGRKVFEALQAMGVIVRPMDGYGLPRHIRISIGTAEENETCLAAIRKVVA
ncbi:MAG: histidinol-phosphate aminotransferase [Kiritimatiellia bacterium]|jgi:histidinol-phosphate aminotransferase